MSELDATRAKLGLLTVIIFLAIDAINPVKMFLHVFSQYGVQPWHIASLSLALCIYIFISEMKALLYFAVKIFFHSILSIFFREVEVIGVDNIPKNGPVIFTGNHANQFIDGVMIVATCHHKISYLIADKSWKRKVIGNLAWALDAVPIKRAQDSAKTGIGKLFVSKVEDSGIAEIQGIETHFIHEISQGDKIRLSGAAGGLKVIEIESDTKLSVENYDNSNSEIENAKQISFDILKKVDLNEMYEKVLDKLASGGCIGMFPEVSINCL